MNLPVFFSRSGNPDTARAGGSSGGSSAVIPLANVIAAYNLEANGNDNSGNGHNLTLIGSGQTFGTGKVGNALTEVGSSYYNLGAPLLTSTPWWISRWVNFTVAAFRGWDAQQDNSGFSDGTYGLDNFNGGSANSPRFVVAKAGGGGAALQWGSATNDGGWHLVNTWVDSSNNMYLKVDNGTTLTKPVGDNVKYDSTTWTLGISYRLAIGNPFVSLDAYHIFNIAPTQAQLDYMWNGGAGRQLF